MTRIRKLATISFCALAMSALILTGSALGPAAPAAGAAVTAACVTKTPRSHITAGRLHTYYLPTASGSTNCFNGGNHRSDAIPVINNALRYGHKAYRATAVFKTVNPTSRLYDQKTTSLAVKTIQNWNHLTEDALLGPQTKDVTYWPTDWAGYSAVYTVYGPLKIGYYQY
ncbi:MAG: hypothetical protein LBG60_03055 [Bifidobacteriaceae bacterium]|jgi:hypothetical protein|nr:hypothetical protein [Bifidobacteriaceae bacterium]